MRTEPLFLATAVIEVSAGLALLVSPALPVWILIGSSFDTPADFVVGRVAGSALLALGLASVRASSEHGPAARGIVSALVFYNVAIVVVLTYAAIGFQLSGIGLWPVVVLHVAMALWCLTCLSPTRAAEAPAGKR